MSTGVRTETTRWHASFHCSPSSITSSLKCMYVSITNVCIDHCVFFHRFTSLKGRPCKQVGMFACIPVGNFVRTQMAGRRVLRTGAWLFLNTHWQQSVYDRCLGHCSFFHERTVIPTRKRVVEMTDRHHPISKVRVFFRQLMVCMCFWWFGGTCIHVCTGDPHWWSRSMSRTGILQNVK